MKVSTLKDLKQDPKNARKHNSRNIGLIESSLRKVGAARSGVIDENGVILAGNGTYEALARAGIERVKVVEADGNEWVVVRRSGLTEQQKRELALADNRAAELAEWDGAILAAQGIDLAPWFNTAELAKIGVGSNDAGPDGPDPQLDKAEALREHYGVELGQIWQLGKHRLMCGDSTKGEDVNRLLDGSTPKYGLHDPPYGIEVVGCSGTVGAGKPFGKGRIGFDGVVKANAYYPVRGDDKPFDPEYLLTASEFCFLWGANYYADKLPPMKGWIVWDKKGREEWRDTFSDCELAWTNLKSVTRIFRHTWLGMVQEGEREARVHPTQKPVLLYQKIISELFSEDGEIIDFYLGSGTTLVACERLGRRCLAAEISPAYVAVAIQRWVDLTGKEPKIL